MSIILTKEELRRYRLNLTNRFNVHSAKNSFWKKGKDNEQRLSKQKMSVL